MHISFFYFLLKMFLKTMYHFLELHFYTIFCAGLSHKIFPQYSSVCGFNLTNVRKFKGCEYLLQGAIMRELLVVFKVDVARQKNLHTTFMEPFRELRFWRHII